MNSGLKFDPIVTVQTEICLLSVYRVLHHTVPVWPRGHAWENSDRKDDECEVFYRVSSTESLSVYKLKSDEH